jgi:predicted nucleic acid-binding protein
MWLASDLRVRFGDRIFPITQDIAQAWGVLQGEAEAEGIVLPTIDGLIGATAITQNLTVVTRNVTDLGKTGAKLLNPLGS